MAVYMSPGVYPREIDISMLATGVGPVRPAFVGTAQKGPMNTPTLITNAQQYIDTFGDPFIESYLGYAVLAYLEEGNQCYVERVGIEYEDGMIEDLAEIAIDTSGTKIQGWGRIPVFTGIDAGKIRLRTPTADAPLSFHDAYVDNISVSDIDTSGTGGPLDAELLLSGSYADPIDDSFTILITSYPDQTSGDPLVGAEYQIYRGSDGELVSNGTLTAGINPNESASFNVGDGVDFCGLTAIIKVNSGRLGPQDSFLFEAHPYNRRFVFWVDRQTEPTSGDPAVIEYEIADGTVCTTIAEFITAFEDAYDVPTGTVQASSEDYQAVDIDGDLYVRTKDIGKCIQLMDTEAFALEVGQSKYVWDIPRSYLIANDAGPFNITTSNNYVVMNVVGETETTAIEFGLPSGSAQTSQAIAQAIHNGGVQLGTRYWRSYALQTSDTEYQVVIETIADNQFDMLELVANYTHVRTLRFTEELDILYPYQRPYRGYFDSRVSLPEPSSTSPNIPESCEVSPGSSQCVLDSAYYQNIVGWFVAPSAGTWIDDYMLTLQPYTEGLGDSAGRFKIDIYQSSNRILVESVADVTFNKNDDRYVGNVINPGSAIGGVNGNLFVNWEPRPDYLDFDPDSTSYEARVPSSIVFKEFDGGENGIPEDPIYSPELDRYIIGNPSLSTGIFAFDNAEVYDINLLATPGYSSGAVIGQSIQMCQSRGDILYIVDPPYGLRPQQVIDWHNGMLFSDLGQAINSSYAALYWSWLEVFDQFSGENIWIPPSGHQLGVFARTANVSEQWFAPAGIVRGRLYSPIDVEYNPTQGERDALYSSGNAVNPIVNFVHDGLTVWGQRTLQRYASALDRVNVRMLLIYIKKNLSISLRPFVFEQNDKYTWARVKGVCDGFLSDIKARRGLDDFRTVCDETTNTPERRDRGELWISVFLKPTRVAEFIVLNLVVMRSDMSFTADEVLQAGGVVTQVTT